jgi:lipopolysaccharide/colanic/teichoic acid biosynthesis glycosyltransferase
LPFAERLGARRPSIYRTAIELLICIAAFATASYAFSPLEWWSTMELEPVAPFCGLVFWYGWHWREGESDQWTGFLLIEQFCIGMGLSVLFQAALMYTELLSSPAPIVVAAGSLAAGVTLAALHPWLSPRRATAVLLIGCDPIGRIIASALQPSPLGVVEQDATRVPEGLPFWGGFAEVEDIVMARRPARIVVNKRNWAACVSPRFLLDCKMAGIKVEEAADTYQKLFFRVSVEGLRPSELAWSSTFRANRLAMAAQTIYSNLAGLIALVGLSPILLVMAILSRLAAGPGPLFERAECAGFQRIPFFRLRFRTRDYKSGKTTGIGAAIDRLRLTNLPQLINIMRGEMALFGPQPVRTRFMGRLETLIPFYSQRLTVKPGLFGWAQVHTRGSPGICEESLRLEYDIYYLAQCSPSMDLEILARTLLGGRPDTELALSR